MAQDGASCARKSAASVRQYGVSYGKMAQVGAIWRKSVQYGVSYGASCAQDGASCAQVGGKMAQVVRNMA